MPIAKEISRMFEFSRNKIALFIDNHFDECTLLQEKMMHRYVLIESHRKASVVNKGDSRPRHLQGKVVNTGLVRQTWGMSLFGPM